MDEAPLAALRRKPRSSIRVAAESGGARRARRVFQRRAHRRVLSGRARGVRHAAGRRSAGAGGHGSDAYRRVRVLLDAGANARVPGRTSRAVRRDGLRLRAAVDVRSSSRGSGLLSIGEEAGKGNELIREAHARLRDGRVGVHRQPRGARVVHGPRRRHRLRWLHGQYRAQGGRRLVEAVEDMLREELGGALVSQIGASAHAPRIRPVPAAGGLRGVRRGAVARRGRPRARRTRPVIGACGARTAWRCAARLAEADIASVCAGLLCERRARLTPSGRVRIDER